MILCFATLTVIRIFEFN